MRTSALRLPAALAILGMAAATHAQSGTITFNGAVTSATCEVSFNGAAGQDPTITLPTVSTASLRAGQRAGHTPVIVHISGADPVCSTGAVNMTLNTHRTASLINGRLRNTGAGIGGGTNVVVGLRDARDRAVDLTSGVVVAGSPSVGGGAEVTLAAEYFADGADAMPGNFQAPLEYTLAYP